MDNDQRQSIHEICLARRLIISPARPEMVTLGPASQRGGVYPPGIYPGRDYLMQMGTGNVPSTSAQTRNPRLRVATKDEDDNWSLFSNPDCLHDRHCGHQAGPRVLFPPGGAGSDERVFESPTGPIGTLPLFSRRTLPYPQTPNHDILRSRARKDMGHRTSTELPSQIGPFLLKSQSSGSSFAEGAVTADAELTPTPVTSGNKPLRTLQKDYYASRTANWVVNLPSEASTVPGHIIPTLSTSQNKPPANPDDMGTSHLKDSAIRGNCIPLSKSFKDSSPSSRREQGSRGVYLQLSLTDSQMDKLTAVLSPDDNNPPPLPRGRARDDEQDVEIMNQASDENTAARMRSRSPEKTYQSTTTPSRRRSRSPVKFNLATPESQRTIQGVQAHTRSSSPSKTQDSRFNRGTPVTQSTPTRSGGRGVRSAPAPIDTDLARAHARIANLRIGKQPAVVVHNPPERSPSPVRQPSQFVSPDDSSSYYSQDSGGDRHPSCISPLDIQNDIEPRHLSILQEYTDKKNSTRGSDKGSEEMERRATPDELSSGPELAYTPLAPFLPQGAPTVRKASKTLIGEGGWLENTSKPEQAGSPTRGGGFLGNLVKKAKEMIETNQDIRAQRKSRESDNNGNNHKSRPTSRNLAISLSPREQSLLYCELEFVIATALNNYITAQFTAGRLEADRLRKVADDWQRKGRPKVVLFRYDMETQLDLVRAHVHDFKFYSRAAATTAILGIIDTAKGNARVLRLRTFCQPDTVIAKQLLDSQSLFNILGCPEDQQIKLAEIIAFFKAAIERRRLCDLKERQQQHQQQQHQHQQQGGHAGPSAAISAVATWPVRNTRSPMQNDDWWGATAAATTTGQLRGGNAPGAARMDPAGYDDLEE
ncbi:hypothetical protein CHGG_10440 [Chaetomium globosum CBS 148.51]|uniref:Uncharacterized protein n=1 Tax=Chaetomium globosum (strain ATCC 6205 / CBS 148.51 / DSM 1962 / NBRC 6347 / NRRL 1970) TaxID=306901 RepID=Q2GNL4_CHAGB|nr:uncharacterized protein CHGG_10440 [Chaetomium globosum CBS 148.51]EAQ84036.1 hypothetical protein CHGG_10440 [Chaetomium globosum CBS 148.51]